MRNFFCLLVGLSLLHIPHKLSAAKNMPPSSLANCSLKDLFGAQDKPRLIFFWASWCSYCLDLERTLAPLTRDTVLKNHFSFSGVSVDEDLKAASKHAKSSELAIDQCFSSRELVRPNFHLKRIPTVLLISKDGKIETAWEGSTPETKRLIAGRLRWLSSGASE